jgi:hypothetical protein
MRRVTILALAMLLGACTSGVYSDKPLFEKSGPQPANGLWALLPEGCEAPASASMTRWPECAVPVWLSDGTATTMVDMSLVHLPLVMANGDPRIIQTVAVQSPQKQAATIATDAIANAVVSDANPAEAPASPPAQDSAPGFQYWAFVPDGPPPYRKGRLWNIACPDTEIPGIAKVDEQSCTAASADAVRAASKLPAQADKLRTAVWIAAQD